MAEAVQSFGRYEIRGELGKGGFATVYRAWDRRLAREVALKALMPHLAAEPAIRQRFMGESQAIAQLHHPNIITVHDVDEAEDRPYFTMELINGPTLAVLVTPGHGLPLKQVAELMRSLGSAIDYLHGRRLVHRDVKASNVMLDQWERVVLMDFGVARALDHTHLTQSGVSIGTPEAMSPEQVRGETVGPPADVYALGVLAYRLLAGRAPFVGDTVYVLHAHAYEPPPPLAGFRPDLPHSAYAAIDAALAKNPADRPLSGAQFAEALAAGVGRSSEEEGSAQFLSLPRRSGATGERPAESSISGPSVEPPVRSEPRDANAPNAGQAAVSDSSAREARERGGVPVPEPEATARPAAAAPGLAREQISPPAEDPAAPPTDVPATSEAAQPVAPNPFGWPGPSGAPIAAERRPWKPEAAAPPTPPPANERASGESSRRGKPAWLVPAAVGAVLVVAAVVVVALLVSRGGSGGGHANTGATTVATSASASGPAQPTSAGTAASVAPSAASSSASGPSQPTPAAVTTLAGSGKAGFADGSGEQAQLNGPKGVAVDANGNVYVGDSGNNRIRRIDPKGTVSLLAGPKGQAGGGGLVDGPAEMARFSDPRGIAVDKQGNVYVADSLNHRIRKIAPDGRVTVYAGNPNVQAGDTGLGGGGLTDGPTASARFNQPTGLAMAGDGTLYVADTGNNRIRKIAPDGTVTTLAGSGDPGSRGGGYADGPAGSARFNAPSGVAIDTAGNVYVADTDNHLIRKVAPDGMVTTLAGKVANGAGSQGSADGPAAAASFAFPSGIAVDPAGTVYVSDTSNHRVRKIAADGTVSTLAGGKEGFADGSGADSRLDFPSGLALSGGSLIVADSQNNRVRSISLK